MALPREPTLLTKRYVDSHEEHAVLEKWQIIKYGGNVKRIIGMKDIKVLGHIINVRLI